MTTEEVFLLLVAGIGVLGSLLGAAVGGWVAHLAATRSTSLQRIQEYKLARVREQRAGLDILMRFNRDIDKMPRTHEVSESDMLEAMRAFDEIWSDETRKNMRTICRDQPREATKEHFRNVERVMRDIVTEAERELGLPPAADPKPRFEALLLNAKVTESATSET